MRRLGIISTVMAIAAVLVALPVKVEKQSVDVPLAPTMQLANSTTTAATNTQQASTVSIAMPVIMFSDAGAVCDPSEGRHSGLALACFLAWLMEVTNASDGF